MKGRKSCNREKIKRRNSSSHVPGYGKEDIPRGIRMPRPRKL